MKRREQTDNRDVLERRLVWLLSVWCLVLAAGLGETI